MKLIIKRVDLKPFTGDDGEERNYFWCVAEKVQDGTGIRFGTTEEYEVGQEVDVLLNKSDRVGANGKVQVTYTEMR